MSGAVFAGMAESRERWERMKPIERGRETLASQATLRDYFAARALNGLLASPRTPSQISWAEIAEHSYQAADAMLAAREAK